MLPLSQVAPWRYYATCRLRACSPHPPGLQLPLLVRTLLIYGVWHMICEGKSILFNSPWDRYRLLGPCIHIWEMKWSALKNLVECGYRRNLVRFLQGRRCNDYGDFFHWVWRVWGGYGLLWTAFRLMEIKCRLLKNLLTGVFDVIFLLVTGDRGRWNLLNCYVHAWEVIAYF